MHVRRLELLSISSLFAVLALACERYPEVLVGDQGTFGTGGSGEGGEAGAKSTSQGIGGGVILDGSSNTSGGNAGEPPVGPCEQASCGLGQRCEEAGNEATCVDNECDDLDCSDLEECVPAAGGGNVCASIACESDVDCPISRYCDGEKCTDDVCEAGAQRCDGNEVYQCTSNGEKEISAFSCGGDAYFQSTCAESDSNGVGCTCEDDWDCPSFTNCEVSTCKGSGVEPTCTLPAVPFEEVLPSLEFRWGGDTKAEPEAVGSPYPNSSQVLSTPLVANLTDDNDDGFINERDFPEVIFMTYPNNANDPHQNGMIRAVHGGGDSKGEDYFALCGDNHWFEGDDPNTGNCSNSDAVARPGGGLAVGDLNYDGVPEIVVELENGHLQILNNRGEIIHTSADKISIAQGDSGENGNAWKYPQVALANLDNQGLAEVIIGNQVITLTEGGTDPIEVLDVFEGEYTQGAQTHGDEPRHLGPNVCVANVVDDDPNDDDVSQEIVAGTTLYRLPTPPDGVTRISECDSADTSDFCSGHLTKVWNAQEVNGTDPDEVPDPEAFCAVADVWGANSAAPGPDNPLDGSPEVILDVRGAPLGARRRHGQPARQRARGQWRPRRRSAERRRLRRGRLSRNRVSNSIHLRGGRPPGARGHELPRLAHAARPRRAHPGLEPPP